MLESQVYECLNRSGTALPENFLPSRIFCPCYRKYTNISDNVGVSFLLQQTSFQEKNLAEKSGRSNIVCAR